MATNGEEAEVVSRKCTPSVSIDSGSSPQGLYRDSQSGQLVHYGPSSFHSILAESGQDQAILPSTSTGLPITGQDPTSSISAISLPNSMASCSIYGSDISTATPYMLIKIHSEKAVSREYHRILTLAFYTSQSSPRRHIFLPTRACAPTPMTLLHLG